MTDMTKTAATRKTVTTRKVATTSRLRAMTVNPTSAVRVGASGSMAC